MPANGRRDLIRPLKVKLRLASTAVTLLTRILEVSSSNLLWGTGFPTEVSRSFI